MWERAKIAFDSKKCLTLHGCSGKMTERLRERLSQVQVMLSAEKRFKKSEKSA